MFQSEGIKTVEPYVDLKVKLVDAFFFIAIGLVYAGVLAGLIYLAAGEDFSVGSAYGFLLGLHLGGLSYLGVYFNNRYILPRIKRVFLWWVHWGGTLFVI